MPIVHQAKAFFLLTVLLALATYLVLPGQTRRASVNQAISGDGKKTPPKPNQQTGPGSVGGSTHNLPGNQGDGGDGPDQQDQKAITWATVIIAISAIVQLTIMYISARHMKRQADLTDSTLAQVERQAKAAEAQYQIATAALQQAVDSNLTNRQIAIATQQSANAAAEGVRVTREAVINTERAYIRFAAMDVTAAHSETPDLKLNVLLRFKNPGRTPATITSVIAHMTWFPKGAEPSEGPDFSNAARSRIGTHVFLPPDGDFVHHIPGPFVSAADFESPDRYLAVFGKLEYEDVFGNAYILNFGQYCIPYIGSGWPMTTPGYNGETKKEAKPNH